MEFSLRIDIPNLSGEEQTSQKLFALRKNKTKQYKGKKLKNKPIRRSPQGFFYFCEENLCPPGDYKPTSRAFENMERRKSEKVQEVHLGCSKKPQAFKNGVMAEEAIELENEKSSLRSEIGSEMETSRHGEGQDLDRGGRVLSFLRASEECKFKGLSFADSSTERPNVERGVLAEKGCNSVAHRHVLLPQQHGKNELELVDAVSEHAEICDTGNLVPRRIVRAVSVGKQHCYDLEVSCSTHNFILPNGVVTSNSHAVAYTFTSARLLYLKAHFPLEFFCSTLVLEGDEDKVKIYKREAERNGIKINRCDLNKSKVNYEIIGNEIYVGFSNIKGIGEDAAKQIVSAQPYSSVEDFLSRFGTDKRVVEPLINLGVFKDAPPNVLMEFYEDFKKWTKGNQDKEKRQNKRREELAGSIKALLNDAPADICSHESIMAAHEEGNASRFVPFISKEFSEGDVFNVIKKYAKSVLGFEHKLNFNKDNSISLENWTSKGRFPSDKWPNNFELERKHYGFSWEHPIQKSPDYIGGHSFNIFKEDEHIVNAGVEVMVTKKPQEKVSKKNNKYYFVLVEDEDWNVEVVTFWSEDYARFKEELEYWNEEQGRGHFLRIRLTRPGSGFKSYTFESPSKAIRHKVVPADKKNDPRLQIMQSPM
jgi:hypothetical protein